MYEIKTNISKYKIFVSSSFELFIEATFLHKKNACAFWFYKSAISLCVGHGGRCDAHRALSPWLITHAEYNMFDRYIFINIYIYIVSRLSTDRKRQLDHSQCKYEDVIHDDCFISLTAKNLLCRDCSWTILWFVCCSVRNILPYNIENVKMMLTLKLLMIMSWQFRVVLFDNMVYWRDAVALTMAALTEVSIKPSND